MDALALVVVAGALLLGAYLTYSRWLSFRIFELDPDARTPACTEEDGRDYCPTRRSIVFGHHFTSIAGTGPIVGPAIAVMWGWLPAILWVVIGCIFVGAVHDLGSLVVSLRNKGRSIGDIAGDLLGPRARVIFLFILIVGLWIVLAIFGLVIAAVLRQYPQAVTPVLVQIPLAILIGLFVHRAGRSIVLPSLIALGVMYASVIYGNLGLLGDFNAYMSGLPMAAWVALLLGYAYVASVIPVWVLLQPRDYINALQLITGLGVLVVGLAAAAFLGGVADGAPERPELRLVAPMIDWQPSGAPPLLPVLFITIACGACSGFHCLVASGTTSKQIERETDARAVGYGSMLTEGFLATLVIAACAAGIGLGVTTSRAESDFSGSGITTGLRVGPVDGPHYLMTAGSSNGVIPHPNATIPEIRNLTMVTRGDQVFARGEPDEWMTTPDGIARFSRFDETWTLRGDLAFARRYESWSAAGSLSRKVSAFVDGAANMIAAAGIPLSWATALMAVMVASFAATTMDTACRLQRYVIQELSRVFLPRVEGASCGGCGYDLAGLVTDDSSEDDVTCPECGRSDPAHLVYRHDRDASIRAASAWSPFRWLATVHGATIAAVVSAFALASWDAFELLPDFGAFWKAAGKGGLVLWPLFGATNQLLAGFAFIVIAAWLTARRKPIWFLVPAGVLMLVVPAAAMSWQAFIGNDANPSWLAQEKWLLVVVAIMTLTLEAWLLVETALRWGRVRRALT
ncbi:MAG: carbon starvation protein A [Phycisphaerales bacterium]